MDEKSVLSPCTVTATAGRSTACDIPRTVSSEPRGLTAASEITPVMIRALEELSQSLETLDRIVQALEQRL